MQLHNIYGLNMCKHITECFENHICTYRVFADEDCSELRCNTEKDKSTIHLRTVNCPMFKLLFAEKRKKVNKSINSSYRIL